jgi:hypothetical protein
MRVPPTTRRHQNSRRCPASDLLAQRRTEYAAGVSGTPALVVGIDAGATKTVAILADETGASLGEGRATGANLVSRGMAVLLAPRELSSQPVPATLHARLVGEGPAS